MTRTWKLGVPFVLFAAAALAATGGFVTLAGIRHTAASTATTALKADVPELRALTDRGALAGDSQVTAGVLLSDPNAGAEQALYHQLYTPGGPLYHHFLSPAAYAQRFGASRTRQDAVRGWLAGGGLKVAYGGGSGLYWVATGKASDVERLFDVGLRTYSIGGDRFYANDRVPTVPASLGVAHVFLTDAVQARTHTPNPSLAANPADLWHIYGAPASDTGQGEQLGIIGFVIKPGDPSLGDALKDYETVNSLPQVPLRVVPAETTPISATDTNAEGEWELDTQASSGMAPGALDIDFYDGSSANLTDGTATIGYWVSDPNGPNQASASWGACEDNPGFQAIGLGYAEAMTAVEQQGVLEGRTLFSSTGDTGSGCVTPANLAPVNLNGVYESPNSLQSMPAAIPWTVAVGGTVLYPDSADPGSRGLEYSWTHGGGGASRFVAEPDYQKADANVNIPCVSDDTGGTGNTGVTCRGVPDVAIMSGDVFTDGYNIQDRSGACTAPAGQSCTLETGGTSLSSPLWLGVWTRVQAVASHDLGFADETIYPIGEAADQSQYQRDFFDVTLGTNGLYHAGPGWDYTSGWGVPNIANLASDVTGNTALSPTHPTSTLPPLPPPPASGGGGGGGPAGPPVSDAACAPLWTDPAGDDTFVGNQTGVGATAVDQGMNPQLDLLAGNATLSADRKTIHFELTINDLSKTIPAYAQGTAYWALFTYGGSNYYAGAEVDPSGNVYYTYGNWASGSFTPLGTTSGTFGSGQNGVVTVDLDAAKLGGPALGAQLTDTGAQTWVLEGVNSDTAAQALQLGAPALAGSLVSSAFALNLIDQTPQNADGSYAGRTYQLGEECSPPSGTVAPIAATEGTGFAGTIATFTDRRTTDQASDLTATVGWSDGTTSQGTVSGGAGKFSVSASHTWSDEGDYTVSVSLTQNSDPNRPAGVATGLAAVADADALSCTVPTVLHGSRSFSGKLASCTDSDLQTPAAGLLAKIDWGDGSVVNYVAVSGSDGAFQVSASHHYAHGGSYIVTVQLVDPGGAASTPESTRVNVS